MYNYKEYKEYTSTQNMHGGIQDLIFFVIDDIANIYCANAFVRILKLQEQTWLLSIFFFTWRFKQNMVSKICKTKFVFASGVEE